MNAKSTTRLASRSRPLGTSDLALVDGPRSVVNQLRREWIRRLIWRFACFIGVPTAAAIVYFGFVASSQYDSIAVLELQVSDPGVGTRTDSLFGSGTNLNAGSRELLAMREFLLSRAMLDRLDHSERVLVHFQERRWDYFSRLSARANREQAYAYYLKKISADYDSSSGTLSLRVRAFDPHVAQALADAIIANIESRLNDTAETIHTLTLRDAEAQLDRAMNRVMGARRNLHQAGGETTEHSNVEVEFAEKAYEASVVALAELRAREVRRRPILVTLAKPSLADTSTYPRRIAAISAVFVFSILGFGIISLTVAAIREHAQ